MESLVDVMAREMHLPRDFLWRVAANASQRYRRIELAKADGSKRIVHHPSRVLKGLQRWILKRVLSGLPVHEAARAYRPHTGLLSNALPHIGSRYLLRMDLKRFFPSIARADIQAYIEKEEEAFSDFAVEDPTFFLDLVCRFDRLAIGAPTSPALSNAICYELDGRLALMCSGLGVQYTRYADDLFFSSGTHGVLRRIQRGVPEILAHLSYPKGLLVQPRKTLLLAKNRRRVVTGIVLTSEGGVSVGRRLKREIRGLIHRLEQLSTEEKMRLQGLLGYCRAIEPGLIEKLTKKYGDEQVMKAMMRS